MKREAVALPLTTLALIAAGLVSTNCSVDQGIDEYNPSSTSRDSIGGGNDPECPRGTYYDYNTGKCYDQKNESSSSMAIIGGDDRSSSSSSERAFVEPSSSSSEWAFGEPSSSSSEQWTIVSSSSELGPSSNSGNPSSSSGTAGPDGGLKYWANLDIFKYTDGEWVDGQQHKSGDFLESAPAYTKTGDYPIGDTVYVTLAHGAKLKLSQTETQQSARGSALCANVGRPGVAAGQATLAGFGAGESNTEDGWTFVSVAATPEMCGR